MLRTLILPHLFGHHTANFSCCVFLLVKFTYSVRRAEFGPLLVGYLKPSGSWCISELEVRLSVSPCSLNYTVGCLACMGITQQPMSNTCPPLLGQVKVTWLRMRLPLSSDWAQVIQNTVILYLNITCGLTAQILNHWSMWHTLQEHKLLGRKICDGFGFSRYSWVKSFANHPSFFCLMNNCCVLDSRFEVPCIISQLGRYPDQQFACFEVLPVV